MLVYASDGMKFYKFYVDADKKEDPFHKLAMYSLNSARGD